MKPYRGAILLCISVCVVALALLGLPQHVAARVADQPLERVARASKAVGIVQVTRIVQFSRWRVAEAQVLEPIRGLKAGEEILFIAQPLWHGDTSTGKEGERAVLLLNPVQVGPGLDSAARTALLEEARTRYPEPRRVFSIQHYGRCRFPIIRDGGEHWVDLSKTPGLRLPPELKPTRQPLSALTNYLSKILAPPARAGSS